MAGEQIVADGRVVIAACVKWVDLRPEIDHVRGTVTTAGHAGGFSEADRSAVEVALRLADAWNGEVVVVCAGPSDADDGLRELLASGASHAIRVEPSGAVDGGGLGAHTAEESASLLSDVLADVPGDVPADGGPVVAVVVCGDVSIDLGSGAVPAYLAHHLGCAQALGLVEVDPVGPRRLRAVRRLDGGRREVLDVEAPAVLSVEGGVAELRRASLASTLAARDAVIEVRAGRVLHVGEPPRLRPWRPPTRVVAAPVGEHALERIVAL
ncbi:MAG: mycofactocin-associated electron transfer flavoprotein beta subunit, partial [Actinobacteria bacterium]|nr:mycofactocin-associated electron transfer flavoprotein beta subunit [Actinomycetota bacterium]